MAGAAWRDHGQIHVVDDLTAEILRRDLGNLTCVALPRSYHVATQDYDRDDIVAAAVDFAVRHTGLGGANT